jgi:CMP-N,N'-diacetyllegionaminic acid synthase
MLTAWGLVPARGGSKSIPMKNLAVVAGRPLLDYGIRAAQRSGRLEKIFCSTDSKQIAQYAEYLGVLVDNRPESLCGDDVLVDDVVKDFLCRQQAVGESLPDLVVLIQPTSPFLLPEHIVSLLDEFEIRPRALSGHTVVRVSHNCHAWNQRLIDAEGMAQFMFLEERNNARIKQAKPQLFVFGNLIAARTNVLMSGLGFYAPPCLTVEIKRPFEFDLDGPDDLRTAEALLRSLTVKLPHLN